MPDCDNVTAVLLIAHGSRHAPANDDLHELAARLSARGAYPIVEPAFLELAQPEIAAGGDRCVARGATRVLMIPYFLAAGVHLRRDLTAARDDLSRRHPHVRFVLGPPLGPDPRLDQLVAERIRQTEDGDAEVATNGWCGAVYESAPSVAAHASTACAEASSAIDTNRAKD
jgi:sirohydrochlorin ferrochelatase